MSWEGTQMKRKSHSLCPECTACPELTFLEDGRVTIGEVPNIVTLTRDEWNVLVRLIQSGVVTPTHD